MAAWPCGAGKESQRPVNPLLSAQAPRRGVVSAMPRFFFHLMTGRERLRDEEGMALPDPEAAWYQAVRSGRELIRADLALNCSWQEQALEIEDEGGLPVDRIPLTEIVQYAMSGG
jgi:hypothetical protein